MLLRLRCVFRHGSNLSHSPRRHPPRTFRAHGRGASGKFELCGEREAHALQYGTLDRQAPVLCDAALGAVYLSRSRGQGFW